MSPWRLDRTVKGQNKRENNMGYGIAPKIKAASPDRSVPGRRSGLRDVATRIFGNAERANVGGAAAGNRIDD